MLLFEDCDGGPQGPRWPIHDTLPHLRWVGKKWFIWQFWETITGWGIKAGFRSKFCCLGALMGVPRVPDDNYMALCHRQGGLRIKMFHLTVNPLGKKHASRVNVVVWGFCWGAPGSQMANTRPLAGGEVGWKKMVHLAERITGLNPLVKWLWKTGLFWELMLLFGISDGGPQPPEGQ